MRVYLLTAVARLLGYRAHSGTPESQDTPEHTHVCEQDVYLGITLDEWPHWYEIKLPRGARWYASGTSRNADDPSWGPWTPPDDEDWS